jgi:hypothetical protein
LSTDGSGNNTLNANTIKDGSATKTLATLSSSAVSLHSDVTFPVGHVIQHKVKSLTTPGNTGRNHDITTSWSVLNLGGAFELTGFSATQGNTLIIQIDGLNHSALTDNTYSTAIGVSTNGTTVDNDLISTHSFWIDSDGSNQNIPTHFQFIYTVPSGFTNKTLSVVTREQDGSPASSPVWRIDCIANDSPSGLNRVGTANLSVMEIQA